MAASRAFRISSPKAEDLESAAAAWTDGRNRRVLAAGEVWWRVIGAETQDQAFQFAATCYASDALCRFTPLQKSGGIVPAAYAGSTREVALWEVILRGIRHQGVKRVPTRLVAKRFMVKNRLKNEVALFDLRRPHDANLVAGRRRPPKLSSAGQAAYKVTRAWAQALCDRIPDIDGLVYESHQVPGDCIVLFQRGDPTMFVPEGTAEPVDRDPIRKLLNAEAGKVGAVVDFGDLPDP